MNIRLHLLSVIFILTACSKSIHPQQLLNDVKELSSDKYQGRKTGTEGNKMAAEYIIKRFEELKLRSFNNSYKQPFSFRHDKKDISGVNIFGYIPGKSEEVFIISAHYDHIGVVNKQVYNGADDNASGVAGLLSIAKYFSKHQPEHTLIFAAFDAEEMGFQGAKAFVAKPPVSLEEIKLNVNLDMISRADKGELFAAGAAHYPELKKHLITTNNKVKLILGHDDPKQGRDDWTNQSDHAVFHKKQIPFIYFGVEDHPDYHRPTDDFAKIDQETFRNCVDIIREVIENLDKNISIQSIFREKVRM